jgi:hypothetical protein
MSSPHIGAAICRRSTPLSKTLPHLSKRVALDDLASLMVAQAGRLAAVPD